MVRKLDLHELRLVDWQRSELAIMAERHVKSAGSVPLRPDSPGGLDESSPIPGIDYLREENRVLREQLGHRRLRFNDDRRRRLAVKAKALGHRLREEMTPIVTWERLLAWHRKLIAQKYEGSSRQ